MTRRRSTLVVPKELLWPLCQRLFLVLLVMCSTALGIRLHALWRLGKLGSLSRMSNHIRVNGTHFFLDIGSGNAGLQGFSHTRKLEDNGWRGVCADPFPDHARSCQTLAMPVTPTRGDNVKMMDCRDRNSHSLPGSCTQVSRNGVTVGDVLKLTRAPKVIDYINLDTEGTELAVLKTFPFQDFCVRSWTVQHRNESVVAAGALDVLESRGCKVTDTGSSHWARCSCKRFSASLLANSQEVVKSEAAKSQDMVSKEKQGSADVDGIVMRRDIAPRTKTNRKAHPVTLEIDAAGQTKP